MAPSMVTMDGNEAAARVAYALSEVIAIYPITPASPMGEWADEWAAEGRPNMWRSVPAVVEMQGEGGAAGAVHGALSTGSLATTFTASQGLLLMLPNMFKIAGELTPAVFHVAARSIAAQALSIFGDHSDVMAARSTGFAMLASNSVQEVMDMALIAHAATLRARVPFIHFFDGFRTSHELMKIHELTPEQIREMIDEADVLAHRSRGLTPDRPMIRGTAQNPDVFFQARESANPYFNACPDHVKQTMERFGAMTGRQYRLFDYVGAADAERVLVLMGSGVGAAEEAVESLVGRGEKVGLIKVRLYRPFSRQFFLEALPESVKRIAVLDRTKEPGAPGEPLYQDVLTTLCEGRITGELRCKDQPRVIGCRYGLSSKEFTPAMVKGVLDELASESKRLEITVGINDDVTQTSVEVPADFETEADDVLRAVFVGLGADGTVGANKNSIKIIGEHTDLYAQGYFVYDSKKAGAVTVSHLRFGKSPIRSTYLIRSASFVACHQWHFLERRDVLKYASKGATVLLNCPYPANEAWDALPREVQEEFLRKELKLWVVDGVGVAKAAGMGGRINTVMQTAFFAISGVLPREQAMDAIREAAKKTYGKMGDQVVQRNIAAIDSALEHLHQVDIPGSASSEHVRAPVVPAEAPRFVQEFTAAILDGRGDSLPVSAMSDDGTYPVATTQWEKRNLAMEIPVWDTKTCIQCNKCAVVCPHAAIRCKVFDPALANNAPESFKHTPYRGREYKGMLYSLQTAPEDCTGCGICVEVCPAKNKSEARRKAINMYPQAEIRDVEGENYAFFLGLPEADRTTVKRESVKGSQFLQPLFEYSGACSGCGETPYLKLLSQLFGDRALVANATGCSSIYGGNLPTTPWAKNLEGRGVAWSNSLFEDNAEFGLGFRLTVDQFKTQARDLLTSMTGEVGDDLVRTILKAPQRDEADLLQQRERVAELKSRLGKLESPQAKQLESLADYLTRKSVWIVGGDGWAYDIGYGGLDHLFASGHDFNILVMDTEVYSNTGGQASKATPRAAVAKFAAAGKPSAKKDLGLLAMSYRSIYVAQVAMGANDAQTVRAFVEAEQYDGPSLIIAYSHCVAHGTEMRTAMAQQKIATECGHWPLFRYNPEAEEGHELQLDSKAPSRPYSDFALKETRFRVLQQSQPERSDQLIRLAQHDAQVRWRRYEQMANAGRESEEG